MRYMYLIYSPVCSFAHGVPLWLSICGTLSKRQMVEIKLKLKFNTLMVHLSPISSFTL